MAKSFWDKEQHIGEAEGLGGKEYRVSLVEKNGKQKIQVKEWWYKEEDDEMYPAKKQGINIPIESAEDIVALIEEALEGKVEADDDEEDEEEDEDD